MDKMSAVVCSQTTRGERLARSHYLADSNRHPPIAWQERYHYSTTSQKRTLLAQKLTEILFKFNLLFKYYFIVLSIKH